MLFNDSHKKAQSRTENSFTFLLISFFASYVKDGAQYGICQTRVTYRISIKTQLDCHFSIISGTGLSTPNIWGEVGWIIGGFCLPQEIKIII